MKLCAPMVEAMGGSDSLHYRHFRTYCCEAYNILRKSATLILSLFHLMAGAAIPDVRQDPEKAMLKLQVCPTSPPQPPPPDQVPYLMVVTASYSTAEMNAVLYRRSCVWK